MTSPSNVNPHKLPVSDETIISTMSGVYWGLVASRNCVVESPEYALQKITKCARWLVSAQCKPSLVLHGAIGTGKTTVLRAMNRCVLMANRKTAFVTSDGLAKMKLEHPDSFDYLLDDWFEFLFIDDVGTEPLDVKNYGNATYPFAEVIRARYDLNLPTIITTNLDYPDELSKKYGERIADRLKEMANNIEFKGNSYRK